MKLAFHQGTIDDVLVVDAKIPEFVHHHSRAKLSNRLDQAKNHLILIASDAGNPIAYKLGYEVSSDEFYSWLGGVIPDYRKQGIASKLREMQENWVIEKGYNRISVKSMNQFPAMLSLLIGSGYKISGYEDKGCENSSKIKFIKVLNQEG